LDNEKYSEIPRVHHYPANSADNHLDRLALLNIESSLSIISFCMQVATLLGLLVGLSCSGTDSCGKAGFQRTTDYYYEDSGWGDASEASVSYS
jgi:hypothetical protein